jgi:citrate lyase subunit beta/citryl-CoA lyase
MTSMKPARRSSLILPINVSRFVERAHTRDADAVVLDMEDSVPPAEKASARTLVRNALPLVARGGAEVMVRINNDPALMVEDVDASVNPGLDGLSVPKAESPEQIAMLSAQLERLERLQGLPAGHVRLSLAFETPRGLLLAQEIAAASSRVATMSVGPEDYCLELGVEPSPDGIELLYAVSRVVTIAKALGIQPTGLLGCIAGFRDLAAFEAAALRARQVGCERARCIHPDQVAVLNRVFTPDRARGQAPSTPLPPRSPTACAPPPAIQAPPPRRYAPAGAAGTARDGRARPARFRTAATRALTTLRPPTDDGGGRAGKDEPSSPARWSSARGATA